MDLVEIIGDSWGFTGLEPKSILDVNDFGNVIVESDDGQVWHICPEELECNRIAGSTAEFERVRASEDFVLDWKMERLVELGRSIHGTPPEGRCFCLKIPGVLGGAYDGSNLGTISIAELLASSGDLALQIKDLPDGTQVRLKVVD